MNIEPIHEIPADELQDILDIALDNIKAKEKKYSDSDLNTLADSIKKSLIFFFPKFDEHILTIIDANEAAYAQSWATSLYPFREGVKALQKLYGLLEGLLDDPNDFNEMAAAIKDYAAIARQYFQTDQVKSAESERQEAIKKMQEAEPLIILGKAKYKQLHAPKEKMNKFLLIAVCELMRGRNFESAKHLLTSFPIIEKPLIIEGRQIYKINAEDAEDAELKAIVKEPNGETKTFQLRAFSKYYKEFKK